MNLIWFLALACLLVVTVNGQYEEGKIHCGNNLVTAMNLVCKGKYLIKQKKDESFDEMPLDDSTYDSFENEYKWPILAMMRANRFSPRTEYGRRVRRGIIEECCEKPCTTKQMLRYCF